jgi:DNA repair exonuclease SbcCD ATPase subunit
VGFDPNRAIVLYAQSVSETRTDVPVGGWDPENAVAHARAEMLAELEPLKAELRERARRIAEREAELERPATVAPDEALAQRARDLAAAERAALEAIDARARTLDLRAQELTRRARELEEEGPLPDPGFVGFSEGFEAFAERRRKRRTPGK